MKKQKLEWHNERRRVKNLVPCAQNPNVNTDQQFSNLKKSIKRDGYVETIVIDVDGTIVAGAHRRQVLLDMGMAEQEIDVRVPNRKLTKEEFDRYLVASNALHGEWDFSKLKTLFDFKTLLDIGMDGNELAAIWDESLETEDDNFEIDKELERIKKPKVKPGEMYQLGTHKILCADSVNAATVERLFGDERADAILTDPPFNIGLSYDRGIGGKGHYGGTVDDAKPDDEYREFLRAALANGLSVCKKDAHVFTYCDSRYVWLLQALYQELGIQYRRTCLWIKNNSTPTPQIAFNKQYEPCIYGTIGSPYLASKVLNLSEILNREVGNGNRTLEDVYDMIDIWLVKRISGSNYTHPTEKPPTLHERALRRCTKPGDIVLDPFSGSASLMVACEQLKRSAYLVEREPIFVELALRRYEKLTGKKSQKIN